jgi:cytochrome c biogenesis protein CcmG/thiol:disulfide interchange protein DsbE
MSALPQNEAPRRVFLVRLIVLVPLALFVAIVAVFWTGLFSGRDPSLLPSVLVGHPAPPTQLPALEGLVRDGKPVPGLAPTDFLGAVTVLNVWASWCVPCRDEAPLLVRLADDKRIRVVGMNQKDKPDDARRFLGRYGNPYAAVGADQNGRAGIEWGVYGVPENFIIGRDGKIAFKLVGPLTPDNLDGVFRPQIEKALAAK